MDFAKMINKFVEEDCDPVEGIITEVQERYDPEESGMCGFNEVMLYLKEHDFFGSAEGVVREVMEKHKLTSGEGTTNRINYAKAF
jgi:hypothetical protein